jgi:hypothetical protein
MSEAYGKMKAPDRLQEVWAVRNLEEDVFPQAEKQLPIKEVLPIREAEFPEDQS